MSQLDSDTGFAGSIPALYDSYMVPLLFEPYAIHLAFHVDALNPSRVLEIAAGTGVLTRLLADMLPETVPIVATDLNQPMIDHAAALGTSRPVEWRQADAMQLPFADESFDVVVCQFGVMFFHDKQKAFAEVRRVLRSGGAFLFNVWDRLELNEFAAAVSDALEAVYPANPPRFMARVPHGYHDLSAIANDLVASGFDPHLAVLTVAATSRGDSPRTAAVALCQGTPVRLEIESRGEPSLAETTERVAAALADRFGTGPVEGSMQAQVVQVRRS